MVVRYKKERTLLLNNLVASMVHTKQDQLATSSNKVKDTIPAGHHVRLCLRQTQFTQSESIFSCETNPDPSKSIPQMG